MRPWIERIRADGPSFDEREERLLQEIRFRHGATLQIMTQALVTRFPQPLADRLLVPVERHALTAVLLGEACGLAPSTVVEIGRYFLHTYSVPVLLLNWQVDAKEAVPEAARRASLRGIVAARQQVSDVPRMHRIFARCSAQYRQLLAEVQEERRTAFSIPRRETLEKEISCSGLVRGRYFRSTSRYLGALLQAVLTARGWKVSPDQERIGHLIGILRQVGDDTVDAREDLGIGVLGLPARVALARDYDSVRERIERWWAGERNGEDLRSVLLGDAVLGEIRQRVELLQVEGRRLAKSCFRREERCRQAVELFVEWRAAFAREAVERRGDLKSVSYLADQTEKIKRSLDAASPAWGRLSLRRPIGDPR